MWTTLLAAAAVLLTAAVAPFFGLLGLMAAAALRRRPAPAIPPVDSPRFLFVIPAHDEEGQIAATVRSCLAVDYDRDRFGVAVVADNCTDATAAVARAAGAGVVERHDPDRRSKGHALEYFFERSAAAGELARYDAAVLVDADTLVDPGLLRAFAAAVAGGADWSQGYYSVSNPDASWRTRLLTYAFSLFNGVWLLGEDRLGLGAGLRGNGMCFTTRGLARHPWRAYGLVEDQEFAWHLRLAGERPRFVPEARVYGEMVSRGAAAVSQRRRWEQGRAALRSRFTRPLLAAPGVSPLRRLLFLADLHMPPLMKLGAGLAAALLVHPASLAFPGLAPVSRALLPLHALMAAATAAYAVAPVRAVGLPPRYLASLAAAPYFAAWKLVAAFGPRADRWVRTRREAAPPRAGA